PLIDLSAVFCRGGICGGATSSPLLVHRRHGRSHCARSSPNDCDALAFCLGSPKMIPKRTLVSERFDWACVMPVGSKGVIFTSNIGMRGPIGILSRSESRS